MVTGQIIKDRVLTVLPTAINSLKVDANANQLVMLLSTRQESVDRWFFLVFELDSLLSQAADQDISQRTLEIGEPGFHVSRFDLNKTFISAVLKRNEPHTYKFITWDFWKCGN